MAGGSSGTNANLSGNNSGRSGGTEGDLLWFDPRLLRPNDAPVAPRTTPFQEAVVFIVGGGNYIEYQNLVDYAKVFYNIILSIFFCIIIKINFT